MQKDHLLQLIKTLSAQEKKTFTSQMKLVYKGKVPYFLELYRQYIKYINKGHADHEISNCLLRFLKRNTKLHNDIANVRNQLKEKILSCLINNNTFNNTGKKIRHHLNIIEFLLSRELYEEAQSAIKQTEKIALQYDDQKTLIELIDWQLYLMNKKNGKNDLVLLYKLDNKLKKHQKLHALELSLRNIYQKLNFIILNDLSINKKQTKQVFNKIYKDIENFPIVEHENQKHTRIVKWYCMIKNIYHRIQGDYEAAYHYSKRLVIYFESNTTLIPNFQSLYIKSICGFTRVCQRTNNYKELEENLVKIQSLNENGENYDILEASCDIGLLYYLNTRQYEQAIELADLMKDEWEIISSKANDAKLLWYCHNNLILFWLTNQLAQFKHWLNEGLSIPRSKAGKAFYFAIRMFDLMHDFDNREFDTFNSKLNALQKTLQNNEYFTAFEKVVVVNFRILYNLEEGNKYINKTKKEKELILNETFLSLKNELENLEFKTAPLNHLEIILWCESYLQNKTIKEVFEMENHL